MAEGALDGAPWVLKIPYLVICYMLDRVFEGRNVPARFFLLETVARMPYFSLHYNASLIRNFRLLETVI